QLIILLQMKTNAFALRHIGPRATDLQHMFNTIGVKDMDQLLYETFPDKIRLDKDIELDPAMTEYEYLAHATALGAQNKVFNSMIRLAYNEGIVPAILQRSIFESARWYTAYLHYQPQIPQGRLDALLYFQTTVIQLTILAIADASILDESTPAAEA